MLPSYFDYIFAHLEQKVRLRPELSPKFLSTLGPNPSRKAWPDLQLWWTLTLNGGTRTPYNLSTAKGGIFNESQRRQRMLLRHC